MPLLFLFILLPISEMWVLIKVGSQIGALTTIGLVIFTAVLGLALLRRQGFETLMRARERMAVGDLPASEMLEGMILAVGGALLLVPGFLTDILGFACLIPPVRKKILRYFGERVVVSGLQGQGAGGWPPGQGPSARRPGASSQGDIIEGEYSRQDGQVPRDRLP